MVCVPNSTNVHSETWVHRMPQSYLPTYLLGGVRTNEDAVSWRGAGGAGPEDHRSTYVADEREEEERLSGKCSPGSYVRLEPASSTCSC